MPTISMFFGIIIMMYWDEHVPPHFHARYGEYKATFDINTGELIDGDFPNNKQKLITAWIEIHRDELLANWTLSQNGEELFRVEPLH